MSNIKLQYNPEVKPATVEKEAAFIEHEMYVYKEVRYKRCSDKALEEWIRQADLNYYNSQVDGGRDEPDCLEMLQVLLAEHERRCQAKK